MQITLCKNRFTALSLDDEESDLEAVNDETVKETPKVGKRRHGDNSNVSMPTRRKNARMREGINDHMIPLNNQSTVKVTMVGDSQLKRLKPKKLSYQHHTVDIWAISGMNIQQAANNSGKCDSSHHHNLCRY